MSKIKQLGTAKNPAVCSGLCDIDITSTDLNRAFKFSIALFSYGTRGSGCSRDGYRGFSSVFSRETQRLKRKTVARRLSRFSVKQQSRKEVTRRASRLINERMLEKCESPNFEDASALPAWPPEHLSCVRF